MLSLFVVKFYKFDKYILLCISHYEHAESPQLCLTLCSPVDCSVLGSSVHGILQARILEWVAMPSSRGSSRPRNQICVSVVPALQADSLLMSHQRSPLTIAVSHKNNFITLQIPPVYHLFNLPTLEPLKTIELYHLCSSVFSRILCK